MALLFPVAVLATVCTMVVATLALPILGCAACASLPFVAVVFSVKVAMSWLKASSSTFPHPQDSFAEPPDDDDDDDDDVHTDNGRALLQNEPPVFGGASDDDDDSLVRC